MKVLLGGIPLGCDNIGDEAILAGVVTLLKASLPDVRLTVATADAATAARLGVAVVPPFGFAGAPAAGFAAEVRRHDAYVWCGATGLSDYPHVGLELLETAQKAGVPTFVWGVGMDDELNPGFSRVHGKRRRLLALFGLVGWYERRLRARLRARLARVLPRCKGVWLRDPQSAAALAAAGFASAGVTADSAILTARGDGDARERDAMNGVPPKVLGLCISTQRQVTDLDGVRGLIGAVRDAGVRVVGLPMNVKTDRRLLERLGVDCIAGTTPEAVMAAAAGCGAVLSSRLHLLILAANVGTFGLGIARGAKVANWLANFGETPVGSVSDCDWRRVTARVLEVLNGTDDGDWAARRAAAYERLHARLASARRDFIAALEGCGA